MWVARLDSVHRPAVMAAAVVEMMMMKKDPLWLPGRSSALHPPHPHRTQHQAHGKHSRSIYLVYVYTEEECPHVARVQAWSQMIDNCHGQGTTE